MGGTEDEFVLYSYFRSSCSARVRTAAHLKGIELEYSYINLLQGDQHEAPYISLNPSGSVPTLVVTNQHGDEIVMSQSIAILEFFEEHYPDTPRLLPDLTKPVERSQVRELCNIINSDVQPVTNLRILTRIKALGGDAQEWAEELMLAGLKAYEERAKAYGGEFSVGNEITLAEVVLAPAVEGALRYGVDLDKVPKVKSIYSKIKDMDAFVKGDWKHQPDTPAQFRMQ